MVLGYLRRMIDSHAIRLRWEADGSKRDERGRRVFAASEARAAGWGGVAAVAEITGLARSRIIRGLKGPRRAGAGAWSCSPRRRRAPYGHRDRQHAARRLETPRRAGDDGRSDAPTDVGLQEPGEAGVRAQRLRP